MGLKRSEHIGKILVDPRDSDVGYVAAQGPLWTPGDDRGLNKTRDGGKSWDRVFEISENTGVSDVAFDPRRQDGRGRIHANPPGAIEAVNAWRRPVDATIR